MKKSKKVTRVEAQRARDEEIGDETRMARAKAKRVGRYVYTSDEAKAITM